MQRELIYTNGTFEPGAELTSRARLPGLVNAHSHAFQRAIRGRTEHRTGASRDTFWTWRESMYHAAQALNIDDLYHVARMAYLEMALAGITAVGEFHYVDQSLDAARAMIRAARDVGIRICLLRTLYMRAGWKKDPNPGQARFLTPDLDRFFADTETLIREAAQLEGVQIGVAPHSVRAVPIDPIVEAAHFATARDLPLHMHVSEQPAEIEACLAEYGRRPVELLHDHGVITPRFTAVHAIHITSEEVRMLAPATVCACPTTERNLGDGVVPADQLLAAGAHIALGSDSNAQIDLLEDARELEYHLRLTRLERAILPAATLLRSATASGARALMLPSYDFFTVDRNDVSLAGSLDSLESNLVFALEKTAIRDVSVAGRIIVRDRQHPLQEEIVSQFSKVQENLWL